MPTCISIPSHHVGAIDRRIFSGFLEHLGRAVYEGVYDPGNPLSDDRGFRRDVLEVLRPLGMPLGALPRRQLCQLLQLEGRHRPDAISARRAPIMPGETIETNQFGTDEFMDWCKALADRADDGGESWYGGYCRGGAVAGILQSCRWHLLVGLAREGTAIPNRTV